MSARPRVGFLGLGWIGQHRMKALRDAELVEIAALWDPDPESRASASSAAPGAVVVTDEAALYREPLDAVVIASPSGLHAEQCCAALDRGLAVFCQKPLARTAAETRRILTAAEKADRLLAVDFSYRHTRALQAVRELVVSGQIGRVFAAELEFHNAYGPNKAWAMDPALSGGGCLIDLGVHLIDSLLWILQGSTIVSARGSLFQQGRSLGARPAHAEDFAFAKLELSGGVHVGVGCSWNASIGEGARIRMTFYGSEGAASFENVDGSFYDFRGFRFRSTERTQVAAPPDDWGGRAIVAWAAELCRSNRFRPAEELLELARAIDALYGRAPQPGANSGVQELQRVAG